MKSKGFIFALSVLMLSLVIVSLASFAVENGRAASIDRVETDPVESPGYVFDDVSRDLQDLLNISGIIGRNETHFWVTVSDTFPFPPQNETTVNLTGYETYLRTVYSNYTHSNTSIDTSGLNDTIFDLPYGISYNRSNLGAGDAWHLGKLYSPSNLTISQIDVHIDCDKHRQGGPSWPQISADSGSLGVNVYYSDLDGTYNTSTEINSTYEFKAHFREPGPDNQVWFIISNSGSPQVTTIRTHKEAPCTILLTQYYVDPDPGNDLVIYFNAVLNYTKANVSRSGPVEAQRV